MQYPRERERLTSLEWSHETKDVDKTDAKKYSSL